MKTNESWIWKNILTEILPEEMWRNLYIKDILIAVQSNMFQQGLQYHNQHV